MTNGVELLSAAQRQYLEGIGINLDEPLGTRAAVALAWTLGQMCNQEFLYEESCDGQSGHSSHRGCGPNGCPYLQITQPNAFAEKYLAGHANSFKDAEHYPVYLVPAARIDLPTLRTIQKQYEAYRAKLKK